ncbi:MAG: hypothetical protein AAF357_16500, partial [Verrucomicrobiota bacterium]
MKFFSPLQSGRIRFFLALASACAFFVSTEAQEEAPVFPDAEAKIVPKELFTVPQGLEATVWATSPQFYNPTNIDIDKDGRIWVAEGVRYRKNHERQPEGDR